MNSERMQYFHLQCPIIVAASVMHFVYLVENTIKLTDDHVTNIHIKGTVEIILGHLISEMSCCEAFKLHRPPNGRLSKYGTIET